MTFQKGKSGNPSKQFQKGKSGNPTGRPVGARNRSTVLKRWLDTPTQVTNPITKEKVDGTVEDRIALALLTKALNGEISAIREVLDSMYGKPKEQLQITETPPEVPVEELDNLSPADLKALLAIKKKLKRA